jgi:hypothetical protein
MGGIAQGGGSAPGYRAPRIYPTPGACGAGSPPGSRSAHPRKKTGFSPISWRAGSSKGSLKLLLNLDL